MTTSNFTQTDFSRRRVPGRFFQRMSVLMVCILCLVLLQRESFTLRSTATDTTLENETSVVAAAAADVAHVDATGIDAAVVVVDETATDDGDGAVDIDTTAAGDDDDDSGDATAGGVDVAVVVVDTDVTSITSTSLNNGGNDRADAVKNDAKLVTNPPTPGLEAVEPVVFADKDKGVSHETPSNSDKNVSEVVVSLSNNDNDTAQGTYTPSSLDIAVGVHVDIGTLIATRYLSALRASWTGKLCIVVYIQPSQKTDYEMEQWWVGLPAHIQVFVYGQAGLDFFKKPIYPINAMRQVLSEKCNSERLIHLDAGLVFSANPVATLNRHHDVIKRDNAKTLFVIPAFELCDDDCESPGKFGVPTTKGELAKCFHAGCCCPFKHTNNRAYGATQHSEWIELPSEKFMNITHVLEQRYINTYEPFVLGVRDCFSPFNLTFPYGFRNKASWHLNLRALGATYTAFPDIFLVHAVEEGDRDAAPQNKVDAWKRNREILMDHMYSFRKTLLTSYHGKPGCFLKRRHPDIRDALKLSNKKLERTKKKAEKARREKEKNKENNSVDGNVF